MKILLLDNYFYRKGGAESVFFNTGDLLEAHGHSVVYFSQKWKENERNEECFSSGVSVSSKGFLERLKGVRNYFYNTEAENKLDGLIKKEKPDVAHLHLFWGGLSSSVLRTLRNNNIPIIHTVHDYRMVCPAYAFKDSKGKICEKCGRRNYYECMLHRCSKGSFIQSFLMTLEMYFRNIFFNPLRYIDGFIFVSNFSKEKHIAHNAEFKKTKNIVLYNYTTPLIDKGEFDGGYFLYYGRLSFEKGIPTLLEVFAKHPELKIKVVGTGPMEDELKKKYFYNHSFGSCNSGSCASGSISEDQKYYENIEFLGYHSGRKLAELVRSARFVCVPSEWYENNPMTIVESYSYGTPVIGARIGGIPEIINDGGTGFLFESGSVEDMERVIMKASNVNDKDYRLLSENAYSFYQSHFSQNFHYNSLLGFYEEVIASK